MIELLQGVILMLQNFKNFLIAFLAGLIIFGLCALFFLSIINGGANDKSNDSNGSSDKTTVSQAE